MVSATAYEELLADLAGRKKMILNCAEAALGPTQFAAFRRIVLDEFGNNGFESKLKLALSGMETNGTGRNSHAGREVSE